jgi:hypothetical protein
LEFSFVPDPFGNGFLDDRNREQLERFDGRIGRSEYQNRPFPGNRELGEGGLEFFVGIGFRQEGIRGERVFDRYLGSVAPCRTGLEKTPDFPEAFGNVAIREVSLHDFGFRIVPKQAAIQEPQDEIVERIERVLGRIQARGHPDGSDAKSSAAFRHRFRFVIQIYYGHVDSQGRGNDEGKQKQVFFNLVEVVHGIFWRERLGLGGQEEDERSANHERHDETRRDDVKYFFRPAFFEFPEIPGSRSERKTGSLGLEHDEEAEYRADGDEKVGKYGGHIIV